MTNIEHDPILDKMKAVGNDVYYDGGLLGSWVEVEKGKWKWQYAPDDDTAEQDAT